MNYGGIKKQDFSNGPGVRTTLFVSGCPHKCKGCFNPESWDYNYGEAFTTKIVEEILEACNNDFCEGLSILGGEPLAPNNLKEISELVIAFREKFKTKKTIWIWTGYLIEDLVSKMPYNEDLDKILRRIDFLVDGPFIEKKKKLNLKFRGSENQRIINVNATLSCGEIVEVQN